LPLDDATLARTDAAVIVLEQTRAVELLRKLPFHALWTRLHRDAGKAGPAPILSARLPNPRHTLVVVGFLASGASGFKRLELAGRVMKEAHKPGVERLQCFAEGFSGEETASILESVLSAALAAASPMPAMKSKPVPPSDLKSIALPKVAGLDLERSTSIAAGNHLARWLTMLPPNVLDCVSYRNALRTLAKREGWAFRFYGEPALRRLGAGAFLAVSQANEHQGAGIVRLSYRPRGAGPRRRIGLVGKGICFDTGGINLKTQKGMYQMHGDMQGSAVAVGTLLAISQRKLPVQVDCWLALTENQIGARAYRPQDIVRACNGVSIQVVHSDAEGRMVLADTLALASREKPDVLVDFATLTGACVNALTERYSGAFTNRADLHPHLQAVGAASGERVWCFPMDDDYDADLETPVADVLQCLAEGKGDHIYAARFLSRFVPAGLPWVHIDLSSSERKDGLAHVPTEYTGFGVRYTTHLLDDAAFLAALGGSKR
jgi:leucyl aminopeptidase